MGPVPLLNLCSHLSDAEQRPRSRFARKKESCARRAPVGVISLGGQGDITWVMGISFVWSLTPRQPCVSPHLYPPTRLSNDLRWSRATHTTKKPSPFPTARGSPLRPSLLGDITWGDIPWGRVISLGDLGCGIIESTPIDEVKALCLSTPGSATRLTGAMVSSDGHNNKTKSLHPPRWPMRERDAFPPRAVRPWVPWGR